MSGLRYILGLNNSNRAAIEPAMAIDRTLASTLEVDRTLEGEGRELPSTLRAAVYRGVHDVHAFLGCHE